MNATTPRNKNQTKQDYETPDDFFGAVKKRFPFIVDLAATPENAKCEAYYTPEENSWLYSWSVHYGWLWLNPPFKNIRPWADKCYKESQLGAKIVMLTPASVGSNWFKEICFGKCQVIFLNGRLTFKGETKPYPKDCMLTVWSKDNFKNIEIWDWRKFV